MANITNISSEPAQDPLDELLEQIRDLVPSAFPDGKLDAPQLLTALGITDDERASFSFTWPGIEEARADARAATTATLIPDEEASLNWEAARDVLIEGDNLQVLKILKAGYRGAAKLIYVDPPYNTGKSFTYNDKFAILETDYLRESGQIDEQGNATVSKIEKGGKKHAPWLTMMFPRLVVARHLLRRDGVFLASIDNNEVHHLRLLLDAVFGASNFVDMVTWRGARKGDAKLTGGGQDYILIYARDREWLRANDVRWRERKEGLEPIYAKIDELTEKYDEDFESASLELKEWFKSLSDEDPSKAHDHYQYLERRGAYYKGDIASPNTRENLIYDWKGFAVPDKGWRYEKQRMEKLDADDRLVYPDTKEKRITVKRFLKEHEDWAPASVLYKDRRAASSALNELMGEKIFDDPKSTEVLGRLFQSLTGDGDLIIDFFAGSGSSGHAVWDQNAKDGMTRNWILVQIPEKPDGSEESGKNAIKAGFETIFEITAERLRRAAQGIGSPSLGFRIFRTAPSFLKVEKPPTAQKGLTGQAYIKGLATGARAAPVLEGADELSVAWELVLKATGAKLNSKLTQHHIDGVSVFEFLQRDDNDSGRLFVSLDKFSIETADALKLGKDDTLILRGDRVDNSTTLTLAPRMQKNLVLLERVPREISL